MKQRDYTPHSIMENAKWAGWWTAGLLVAFFAMIDHCSAQKTAAEPPKGQRKAASAEEVREHCKAWVQEQAPDKLAEWEERQTSWNFADPLQEVLLTIQLVDPAAAEKFARIATARQFELGGLVDQLPVFEEPWIEGNSRFWLARELSQRQLYEEALDQFAQIDAAVVIDPAGYFFHRAVCEHHLLKKEAALASLNTLLTECPALPTRYRSLGELMQQDLNQLEDKSLNEIARKMRDVERRLDLGRSGQKVQKLEKEIIESLDELIAKLEQQSGGGGGGGGGNPGGAPNGAPQQGRSSGGAAPGEVDDTQPAGKDGWGSLPPREKAEAKQILGTMFPPHYQRAIEAYNRKAAQREQSLP